MNGREARDEGILDVKVCTDKPKEKRRRRLWVGEGLGASEGGRRLLGGESEGELSVN